GGAHRAARLDRAPQGAPRSAVPRGPGARRSWGELPVGPGRGLPRTRRGPVLAVLRRPLRDLAGTAPAAARARSGRRLPAAPAVRRRAPLELDPPAVAAACGGGGRPDPARCGAGPLRAHRTPVRPRARDAALPRPGARCGELTRPCPHP